MWSRRARRGIACQELVELVTAYLDDALPAADRARFEAHLVGCDDCTAYVAQFVQTLNAVGALPDEELDPAALDALLAVFRDYARSTRRPARNGRAPTGD
jgi:anti-sigma factor RsiW